MNDFTKEELKELNNGLGWAISEGGDCNLTHLLRDKLQNMIDNYCEHEWINATYCEKCNRGILDE